MEQTFDSHCQEPDRRTSAEKHTTGTLSHLSACQCQIVSYHMTAHDRYMHDMQYTDPSLLEAVTKLTDQQITSAKLDAVEKLLWGHVPRQPGKSSRGMLILLLQIV